MEKIVKRDKMRWFIKFTDGTHISPILDMVPYRHCEGLAEIGGLIKEEVEKVTKKKVAIARQWEYHKMDRELQREDEKKKQLAPKKNIDDIMKPVGRLTWNKVLKKYMVPREKRVH